MFVFGRVLYVDVTVITEGLSNPIGGIAETPVQNERRSFNSLSPARLGMFGYLCFLINHRDSVVEVSRNLRNMYIIVFSTITDISMTSISIHKSVNQLDQGRGMSHK